MAVDGSCFVRFQLHELLNEKDGFGAVASEVVFLVNSKNRNFLPNAVNLLIPIILFIEIAFAEIMEESGNRHAFYIQLESETFHAFDGKTVNIEGMLTEAAVIRSMVSGAGGRSKEISFLQPGKQILQTITMDLFTAGGQKDSFVFFDLFLSQFHIISLYSDYLSLKKSLMLLSFIELSW